MAEKPRQDRKAYHAEYYRRNREKILKQTMEWQAANPEKVNAAARARYPNKKIEENKRAREYHEKNADVIRARHRKYRSEHPEKIAKHDPEKQREWIRLNPEKWKQYQDEWRAKNPEKVSAAKHRRRAREREGGENFTAAEISLLRAKCGRRCAICKKVSQLQIDHIVPLAKRGSNAISNIQLLCKSCNSAKRDRDPIDFARARGLLL